KSSFAAMAVAPASLGGEVYVVYPDQPSAASAIEFVAFNPAAPGVSSPVSLNDDAGTVQHVMPAIACDDAGAINVSWFDTRNAGGGTSSYDIYATYSIDNGATFAHNTRVSASTIAAGSASFIG